jgi:hypothetical protein
VDDDLFILTKLPRGICDFGSDQVGHVSLEGDMIFTPLAFVSEPFTLGARHLITDEMKGRNNYVRVSTMPLAAP